jgi:hypothetical protein
MSIVPWILQVLLAAQFLFHGWIMLFPPAELVEIMNAQMAPWFRIFVGVSESLDALGLILPGVTRILLCQIKKQRGEPLANDEHLG